MRVVDDLSTGRVENLAPLEVGTLGSGAPVEFVRADIAAADGKRGRESFFGLRLRKKDSRPLFPGKGEKVR